MPPIVSFRKTSQKIRHIRLHCHAAAINVDDLASLLEIDLQLGNRGKFRNRLHRALNGACRQGAEALTITRSAATKCRLVRKTQK